jgi:hypothetical protein
MEKVGIPILWPFGIFYSHLVYFMNIWECCGNSVYFSPFWYIASRKIWQPWPGLWLFTQVQYMAHMYRKKTMRTFLNQILVILINLGSML